MKTEADFDAAFQGDPFRVSFKDLEALYGGSLNVLDAIIRDQIPPKYRQATWDVVRTDALTVRALTLAIKLLEDRK